MSFLDKAKEKATQLASTAKEKVDDFKDQRKVDDLLADLGRITFRQHSDTGGGTASDKSVDTAEITRLVGELEQLQTEGAVVVADTTTTTTKTPEALQTEAPAPTAGFAPPTSTHTV